MKSYYVLWIPQVDLQMPSVVQEERDIVKLRDIPDVKALYLYGRIDTGSLDITLSYGERKKHLQSTLTLHLEEKHREGFVVYSYEYDEDVSYDFLAESLKTGMHKAIYHYIKGFFHKHQFHDSTEDSLLKPYFSQASVNWYSLDQRVAIVSPLLESYALKYTGCYSSAKEMFEHATTNLHQGKNIRTNVDLLKEIMKANYSVIFGESKYCEYLLDTFHQEITPETREEIRNDFQRLKSLYNDIERWDNFYSSLSGLKSDKISIRWGMAGVALSIVSMAITFGLDAYNKSEAHQEDEETSTYQQDIQKQMKAQNNKLDSIANGLQLLQEKTIEAIGKIKNKSR